MTPTPGSSTEFALTQYSRLPDCPHCGAMLLPPVASEFLGPGRMRHTWACEDCGQELRLAVSVARGRMWARRIR